MSDQSETFTCLVCGTTEPSFRWTDTHGIAACRCGTPYRLYHYDENDQRVEKAPSLAIDEEWLPLARQYWQETQRRVFPGAYDMGVFRSRGGRTYSGATEDDISEFDAWMKAHKDQWPSPVEAPAEVA